MAKRSDYSVTGRDGQPDLGAGQWREAWRELEAAPAERIARGGLKMYAI